MAVGRARTGGDATQVAGYESVPRLAGPQTAILSNCGRLASTAAAVGGHLERGSVRRSTWRPGRQSHGRRHWYRRHPVHHVPPRLAFSRGHELPAFGILQKLLTFLDAQAGEFLERPDALRPLLGRKLPEGLQGLLDLAPFRFPERA